MMSEALSMRYRTTELEEHSNKPARHIMAQRPPAPTSFLLRTPALNNETDIDVYANDSWPVRAYCIDLESQLPTAN